MSDILSSAAGPLMPVDPVSALVGTNARQLSAGMGARSVEQAAKDFESVLLYRMLEEMKRTIPDSGLLETGVSKQVEDIFWYHLAQEVASKGGLGLWSQFHGQLTASPGATETPAEPEP